MKLMVEWIHTSLDIIWYVRFLVNAGQISVTVRQRSPLDCWCYPLGLHGLTTQRPTDTLSLLAFLCQTFEFVQVKISSTFGGGTGS